MKFYFSHTMIRLHRPVVAWSRQSHGLLSKLRPALVQEGLILLILHIHIYFKYTDRQTEAETETRLTDR